MKKHIITIAGRPGSGKSSTAKGIAKELDYKHFSSGDVFRELAKERGVDVLQANLSAEKNAEIDYLVDSRLREIYETKDNMVIDSRIAWHWMPGSFKVFLDLDLETAASRILRALEQREGVNEDIPKEVKKYATALKNRLESENRRYKQLYNIDPANLDNYDLVIDTGQNNLKEVIRTILSGYEAWQKKV